MNETVCDNLIESVKWTEPGRLVSLAILEFINILVIVGNCLVIAAVFCSNKLRSVTNYFIVNLAVADLLVGLAVLPFSATWEVYKVSLVINVADTEEALMSSMSIRLKNLSFQMRLVPVHMKILPGSIEKDKIFGCALLQALSDCNQFEMFAKGYIFFTPISLLKLIYVPFLHILISRSVFN